ncbi:MULTISPECIES: chorismate pyruvate-lyase family protein [unclassified Janthinobacterium]|uniref:chorismate pyruvate-lyase family protein n=1 Tax=unclassified Janthinobacterium TaxID=2610881 RepID=UPI00160BC0FF|nr:MULTISPECIES: chorismate pyruvate-lyase family protein [unclassified Janthinobacterium]MBB5609456.1 chorismate-pyruvate lyase [Janthinobacterium sp. S3T4]MBB5614697.1 chorismate-pyruvate lyase [Janthinobacterium sp. S3M3]
MPASTATPHRPSFLNPHLPLRDNQQIWPRLAPISRALLSTDGSFTLMLQSLSSEDIKPSVLRHQQVRSAGAGLDGCFEEGELLLQRAVLLKTARSGRNLVYADSSIAVQRLPAGMQQALLYRRYRIDAGGQPLMHICEYFCASLFAPDER